MDITNFSGISAYYNGKNTFGWTNTLARSAAFPVEKFSVFGSLEDAQKYVNGEEIPSMGAAAGLAYAGQIIAVANADGSQTAYLVDPTVTGGDLVGLRPLATGGDAEELKRKLNELSSYLLSADGIVDQLSDAIDNVKDVVLPLSVSTLEQNLSIALTSEAGTGTTLKTYTLTQGGQEVGKIDIPKDMVIEAAGLVVYDGQSDKISINGKEYDVKYDPEKGKPEAGEYIVMITAVTEDQIWIPVADLVHDSTGGSTTTISVGVSFDAVQNKNVIKADILPGTITESLLSTDLTTKLADLRTDINAVSTDLGLEIVRAKAEEKTLSDLIEAEATARYDADDFLSTTFDTAVAAVERSLQTLTEDLAAEEERAKEAEADILSAVTEEEERAEGAEADLQAAIAAEETRAKAEESALSGMVNAEQSRAEGAEAGLQTAIDAEETRAKAEESTLSGMVTTERTERTAADTTLQTNINNLSTTLTTAINTEASTRETQDAALDAKITANSNAIAAEKTRAEAAEGSLDAKIESETTRATGKEGELATAIAAEEARAKGEESSLSGMISAENTRSTQAEEALQASINALSIYADNTFETKTDATSKYEDLTGQVDAEATARSNADIALEAAAALSVKNLSVEIYNDVKGGKAALTGENKIATLADIVGLSGSVYLLGKIENDEEEPPYKPDKQVIVETYPAAKRGAIVMNTKNSKEYVCFAEIGATAISSDWNELGDEGLYATKAALEAEVQRATAAEQANAAAIDAEETRALSAEADLLSAINVEETRASTAEAGLQTAIESEAATARAAESSLSVAIDSKVKIQAVGGTAISSDLQIVEISEEDYMAKVAAGSSLVEDGKLYVMKPEGEYAFNAYNNKIVNVATPTADNDAANKKYVDDAAKAVEDKALSAITLNGLEFAISNNKATLNIDVINCGTSAIDED